MERVGEAGRVVAFVDVDHVETAACGDTAESWTVCGRCVVCRAASEATVVVALNARRRLRAVDVELGIERVHSATLCPRTAIRAAQAEGLRG